MLSQAIMTHSQSLPLGKSIRGLKSKNGASVTHMRSCCVVC
uniref:Uncharacterized protein n=1 Tax=Anguilla anguilla TaxID=7936 RepID=A0A0E9SCW2_ANGAN